MRSTIGALCFLFAGAVFAADGDATKEQCTCNIAAKVGSSTENAAACVRQHFENWCKIYVAALEGGTSHQRLVASVYNAGIAASQNTAQMTDLLAGLYEGLVNSTRPTDQASAQMMGADKGLVFDAIKRHGPLVGGCVQAFRDKRPITVQDGNITCSVGELSKWLSLTVVVEGRRYSFLLAPPS
jgi:hypothetical protein